MLSGPRFDAMLNEMGQQASWRRAYDCPCRDTHSGAAKQNCPSCHGTGITWGEEIIGTVAVAGQKVQQQWAKLGMYESGDQVLSLPSDSPVYWAGGFDRLIMAQSSTPFSRTLTHEPIDKLSIIVELIERVFWLDENGVIVEGGIPEVSAGDGALTWASGEPPIGTQYSITGRRMPEYFVFQDFPQDRAHFGGSIFPRRVVVRLMDLFAR